MDMDMDMHSSSSSSMSGHSMAMAFTNSHDTPLFSEQWTPNSTGSYAGTCIFLIILAVISRMLACYRQVLEARWYDRHVNRRYLTVSGEPIVDQEKAAGSEAASEDNNNNNNNNEGNATLTLRGVREQVKVIRTPTQHGIDVAPWKLDTDLPRACVFTVQHGVGYLLMLAVMTLNVGYFLSVLAGLFLGELALGRFTVPGEGSHH